MQLSEGVFRFFYHNQIKNNHQEKRKIPFCCAKYGSYGIPQWLALVNKVFVKQEGLDKDVHLEG